MKNKYSKIILVLLTVTVLILSFVSATPNLRIKTNEPLDKVTFIHYKDGTIKQMGGTARLNTCYALLGVKQTSLPVSYVINPGSYDPTFVTNAISAATKTWDDATPKTLFGSYTIDPLATWDTSSPEGKNAYVFGLYPDSNVIAVTVIWYTRYGMQIVDYDVLFNTYYTWKDCLVNGADCSGARDMDLQDIATHETGHGIGLADIYQSSCSAVTMYGYASAGETLKRTLEQPDITALRILYGSSSYNRIGRGITGQSNIQHEEEQ